MIPTQILDLTVSPTIVGEVSAEFFTRRRTGLPWSESRWETDARLREFVNKWARSQLAKGVAL